jgi:prenyltransferase beta subunit
MSEERGDLSILTNSTHPFLNNTYTHAHAHTTQSFILQCQDQDDGGIADRPGNVADVFHTFFGIAGLALLRHFDGRAEYAHYRPIDPVYALPADIVRELGLKSQVLLPPSSSPPPPSSSSSS